MKIDFTDYQYKIVSSVTKSDVVEPQAPWKNIISDWVDCSVGAIGFTNDQKYLVCTDGDIRWCYDLDSGESEVFNQNSSECYWDEEIWDSKALCVSGFGEFENTKIRTSGIFGHAAGFLLQTEDGWRITNFTFPYCDNNFLLQNPNETVFCREPKFTNIHNSSSTHIAHGFTPNGLKLVIADRDQILVYSRSVA